MSLNSPPLSSYRFGNQVIQEHEETQDYQVKMINLRRQLFVMCISFIIMLTVEIVDIIIH